jgi:hypothetical protein
MRSNRTIKAKLFTVTTSMSIDLASRRWGWRFRRITTSPPPFPQELAEIANKAKPGLLILYHRANPGGVGRPNPEDTLLEEIRRAYGGKVVTGHDLEIF